MWPQNRFVLLGRVNIVILDVSFEYHAPQRRVERSIPSPRSPSRFTLLLVRCALCVVPMQFDDDFYEFRCSIKELERRLGAVVSLAFDDCATVYGRFKLLDSFEGLLERPIIQV